MIGGRVEQGETVGKALRRELAEEIGVVPVAWEGLCSVLDTGPEAGGEATYHMYRVRSWAGAGPVMANDEHTALRWFTVEEACALPGLALNDYRAVFRSIPDRR